MNVVNAALSGGSKPVVLRVKTVAVSGDDIDSVLCTLRPNTNDQTLLQLVFGNDVPVKFSITGGDKDSKLYVSGYFQPAPLDDDEDDDEDDDDEDDDEAIADLKKSLQGKGEKVVVEEDSEDDSEDDDDEEGVNEEFIKV